MINSDWELRMRKKIFIGTIGCLIAGILGSIGAFAGGQFSGSPITKWEDDGRLMTLMESFEYVDAKGRTWRVPGGVRVDGASIPQVFWSLIGGPFEGKYRNASVIHDYFCATRKRRWQDVHKVFHEAMLTSGVDSARAYVMYKAVEEFGPRWEEPKIDPKCLRADGKFDFEKCTQDSGVTTGKVTTPRLGKEELHAFAEEMKSVASPEDLEKLRALAN